MHTALRALAFVASLVLGGNALAQSTVNPQVPAQNAPLSSAPVRSNFAATFNDINGLLTMHPSALVSNCSVQSQTVGADCLVTGSPTAFQWYKYMGATGFALIATINPSTTPPVVTPTLPTIASGHLLANCTSGTTAAQDCNWNNFANFGISSTNNSIPYRTGGTWGTILTGTSGNTVPLNNTANTFSAMQTISLNSTTLPTSVLGNQALRLGGFDGSTVRAEVDNFGGTSHFSAVSYGGPNGSPAALPINTEIGAFNAWGYNGSAIVGPKATVRFFTSQLWTTGANGTYIDFATTPNGSTTLTSAGRVENDGGLTWPSTVTGGSQGAGSHNLNSLFIQGVNLGNFTFTAPSIGTATGASLALNGCTITGFVLCTVGAEYIASSSANALAVGPNGPTNPTLQIDASATSQATGIRVHGNAAGAGIGIDGISSGTNEALGLNAKGSGVLLLGNTSTGGVDIALGGGPVTVRGVGTFVNTAFSAPAAGQTLVFGTISTGASLTNNGSAAVLNTSSNGLTLTGKGSSTDFILVNSAFGAVFSVPTGTTKLQFPNLAVGTCVSGLALDSGNNSILTSCPGAAASIQLGTTGITGGTPVVGNCLSIATGPVLGQLDCARLSLADQTLSGGANVTTLSLTTGSVTIDCGARPLQSITNNGAFTITAPANDGSCLLLITNGASAAAITFSGFTVGANTGEAFTTTNTNKFLVTIARVGGVSTWMNKALQ